MYDLEKSRQLNNWGMEIKLHKTKGLVVFDGIEYFIGEDSKLHHGFKKIDDKWYFFDLDEGDMLKDQWLKSDNNWYCFGKDGAMLTGEHEMGGRQFYLACNGVMVTGLCNIGKGVSKYFHPVKGYSLSGWIYDGDKVYHAKPSGVLDKSFTEIDGIMYFFDPYTFNSVKDKRIDDLHVADSDGKINKKFNI